MKAVDTILHPKFTTGKILEYDLALIRLPAPICDVPIPTLASVDHDPEVGQSLTSLGWGGWWDNEKPVGKWFQDGARSVKGVALQMGSSMEVAESSGCHEAPREHVLCLLSPGNYSSNTCKGALQILVV